MGGARQTKKKSLRNSDRGLGSARYAGSDRGFRPALVGEDRDRRRALHRMARCVCQQILRLARTLRKVNEHNSWVPRDFRLEGLGEAGHPRIPSQEPAGGLPPAYVHDARRIVAVSPNQRMARVGAGGTIVEVERQAVEEGQGL